MIDTDKYEGTNWDLRGQFTHTEMADEVLLLLAEVKRLREEIGQLKLLAIRAYEANENRGTGECEDLKAIMEMIE